MEAQELRQFAIEDLKGRIRQWQEELFRARIRRKTQEFKDTSIFRKLRRDIARAKSVLNEKSKQLPTEEKPKEHPVVVNPQVKEALKNRPVVVERVGIKPKVKKVTKSSKSASKKNEDLK